MSMTPEDVIRDMHATRTERDELRKVNANLQTELEILRRDYESLKEMATMHEKAALHYMRLAAESMASFNNITAISQAQATAISHGRYRQNGSGARNDEAQTPKEEKPIPAFLTTDPATVEQQIADVVANIRSPRPRVHGDERDLVRPAGVTGRNTMDD